MTITCQPMDATSGAPAYSAQNERQNMSVLYGGGSGLALGARSGWRIGTPSNVLTATATQWTLAPSAAVINPGAATAQGSYRWSTDSNVTAANNLNAADATNTRIDIVYIQVNDSSSGDASGALSAPVLYAAGVPSASPVAPTLPPRSFLVGTITVPKVGGGSPTVVQNPAIFVAAGGIQPIFSPSDRSTLSPYVGMEIQRMDLTQLSPTGIREKWNGTNWDHFGQAEFTTATNTAAANTAWGMGTFSQDAANTTDTGFVTIQAIDQLKIRDAGLYSVTVLVAFTTALSGVSWLSVDGTYTTTMGGGLQNFVSVLPNVRFAAGAILKPLLSQGTAGNASFTSRVRVTRIA